MVIARFNLGEYLTDSWHRAGAAPTCICGSLATFLSRWNRRRYPWYSMRRPRGGYLL